MKKHIIYSLLSFLGLCSVVLTGCSKEEIVFDHELPMFETRDGQQLLEVIMPKGTVAGDEIYIVGEFNGGQETAVGDPRWQLEQSSKNDIKWGIYLDPADFVNGKSLSDGYYFYSASQREEVSLRNEPVLHTAGQHTSTSPSTRMKSFTTVMSSMLSTTPATTNWQCTHGATLTPSVHGRASLPPVLSTSTV